MMGSVKLSPCPGRRSCREGLCQQVSRSACLPNTLKHLPLDKQLLHRALNQGEERGNHGIENRM